MKDSVIFLSLRIQFLIQMKKLPNIYITILIVLYAVLSCGKDGGQESSSTSFDLRKEILGEWEIHQARFDKGAAMTDWELETTRFTFKENGYFETQGYFGSGSGSFSIKSSQITTLVNNQPFMDILVNGIKDGLLDVVATLKPSEQRIWMSWYQPNIIETPPTTVPPETAFSDEQNVQQAILSVYSSLSPFIVNKYAIEADLCNGRFEKLYPDGSEIKQAWAKAYESLHRINAFLSLLSGNNEYTIKYTSHIAHIKALRALLTYNLATVWGKARYEETPHDIAALPPVLMAAQLLEAAQKDLEAATQESYSLKGVAAYLYLNPTAAQLLLAEVYLSRGDMTKAKEIYNRISQQAPEQILVFNEVDATGVVVVQSIPVYTRKHVEVLAAEAAGQTEGLPESWKQQGLTYGYWQMLKRLGKAETVTGCQRYQLLFPYPWNAITDGFTQNEGY